MYEGIVTRIEKYCREKGILHKNSGIVVGLSGGADSVFLLQVLKDLQQKWNLRLYAVHVNHGIRGEEALRDERFAGAYAEELGIPYQVFYRDIPKLAKCWHMGEEEAGRAYRYQCLEQVREEQGYDSIAVAHHRDDQAETILFQMLRGSAVRGLGGMRAVRGNIIRPMLCVSKKEILQALQEKEIAFCVDGTNEELLYRRNRIRKEVFPLLQQIQPGAVEHLARMGEEMQEVMAYLEEQTEEAYCKIVQEEGERLRVEVRSFLEIPLVLQKELILKMLERMAGQRKDIGSVHVNQLQRLVRGETGKQVDLPYGLQGWKEYAYVYIGSSRQEEREPGGELPEKLTLEGDMVLTTSEGEKWVLRGEIQSGEKLSKFNLKKYCTKCFDYDRMDTMPIFRYPQSGDYMWLDTEGHQKKLSRIFVDGKIPLQQRKRIPVLAVGNHVLWIPELGRQSACFYVSRDTKEALCVHRIIK